MFCWFKSNLCGFRVVLVHFFPPPHWPVGSISFTDPWNLYVFVCVFLLTNGICVVFHWWVEFGIIVCTAKLGAWFCSVMSGTVSFTDQWELFLSLTSGVCITISELFKGWQHRHGQAPPSLPTQGGRFVPGSGDSSVVEHRTGDQKVAASNPGRKFPHPGSASCADCYFSVCSTTVLQQ